MTKPVDVKTVEAFIQKNPNASYSEFLKNNNKVKISDGYYYIIRRKITGGSKKKSRIYIRIFKTDLNSITKPVEILKQFVDALNVLNNTKIEIIEYSNPPQIEVREAKNF